MTTNSTKTRTYAVTLSDGTVVVIPPERQLTRWAGPNPYTDRCAKPVSREREKALLAQIA